MATKLEVGQIYKATAVRSGTSSRGPWMFTSVVDDRGRNEITLFITNTDCNLRDNQQFKITELRSITLGVRKSKKDEKWYPSYTAESVIEPIPSDFEDLEIEEGADPWAELSKEPWDVPGDDELPL